MEELDERRRASRISEPRKRSSSQNANSYMGVFQAAVEAAYYLLATQVAQSADDGFTHYRMVIQLANERTNDPLPAQFAQGFDHGSPHPCVGIIEPADQRPSNLPSAQLA